MKESITREELAQLDRMGVVADQLCHALVELAALASELLAVEAWDEQARQKLHCYYRFQEPQSIEQLLEALDVYVEDQEPNEPNAGQGEPAGAEDGASGQ